MNKDLFIDTINQIEELHRESEEVNSVLKKIDPEFGGGYIHNKSITILENLVKALVNDQYDNIGYYMWEIDFGKGYKDGMITDADGNNIRLSNASELYDLIMSDNEK